VYITIVAALTMSSVTSAYSAPVVAFFAASDTVATVGRPTYSVNFSRFPLTRRTRSPGIPRTADWRFRPRSKTSPLKLSGTRNPPLAAVPSKRGTALAMGISSVGETRPGRYSLYAREAETRTAYC
jgi:hypothetical protein